MDRLKKIGQAAKKILEESALIKTNISAKGQDDSLDEVMKLLQSAEEKLAALNKKPSSLNPLPKQQDDFERLYDESPVMMHSIDKEGKLVRINHFWEEKMGYKPEEVLGRPSTDFLTEESKKYAKETVLPAFFRDKGCENVPYQFVKKNGEIMDVLLTASAEFDEEGNYIKSWAYITDITKEKQAENNWRKLKRQYKAIFENALVGIAQARVSDGVLTRANEKAAQICGYVSVDAMLGQAYAGKHLEDEKLWEEMKKDFAEKGCVENQRMQILKQDGGVTWVRFSARLDKAGNNIDFFVNDITKEVEYELLIQEGLAHKDFLLQELQHRVKNNMQMIASLVDLQENMGKSLSQKEIFENLRSRIGAVSLVHQMLYDGDSLDEIDALGYFQQLVKSTCHAFSIKEEAAVEIFCPQKFSMDLEQAVPCGLIVGELITNSFKHAGNPKLKIVFTAEKKGEEIILSVSDNGENKAVLEIMQKNNKKKSLGIKLMQTLSRQLRGKLSFEYDKGLKAKLVFKSEV